jgi:hypothetical protein
MIYYLFDLFFSTLPCTAVIKADLSRLLLCHSKVRQTFSTMTAANTPQNNCEVMK